jgi:capsid protein
VTRLKTSAEIVRGRRYSLGYQSVESSDRRRPVTRRAVAEGVTLNSAKREIGNATAREDRRNMTLLAWMIRRHIGSVARFTPMFRLSVRGTPAAAEVQTVNQKVKTLLAWHGKRQQFDTLQVMARDEWMWMFEACKAIGGDCGGLRTKGWRRQGIEPDRIRKDPASKKSDNVNDDGLSLNPDGTRKAFSVCKRTGGGFEFERMVPASEMVFDGYWPERFDSGRGVSPLLTCLNEGADIRETIEYLILKVKGAALRGFAFTRASSDEPEETQGESRTTAPGSESASYSAQVAAGVKMRGLVNLDLDVGDAFEEIGSNTPNSNVVPLTREMIRGVLLAFDIPFTFYDSLTASFSARIADRNEYEEMTEPKRDKNIAVLGEIYDTAIFEAWATVDLFGFGEALEAAKLEPEEIAMNLKWAAASRAWLDRSSEMSGNILALAAGLESIPNLAAGYGVDPYELAAEQKEFLETCGIPLLYAQGGQVPVNDLLRQAREGQIADQKPAESGRENDDEQDS